MVSHGDNLREHNRPVRVNAIMDAKPHSPITPNTTTLPHLAPFSNKPCNRLATC